MTLKHLIHSKETSDFKIRINCPISRVMSDSLIKYFIWSVTLKQSKYSNSMQTAMTPEIWILMSKIDPKHFIPSVLMNYRIKTYFSKNRFWGNSYTSNSFFWKTFARLPSKIKVVKKQYNRKSVYAPFKELTQQQQTHIFSSYSFSLFKIYYITQQVC